MPSLGAASTAATRSLTPQVLTWTPKTTSASVLSPSVTATYRMLSPNRASFSDLVAAQPAAARAQVPTVAMTRGIGDVAGHGLAGDPEPGLDVTELAVTVRGLVQVHEVHVDVRPRQGHVGLRVQVQQRLAERLKTADPHLRGGERVHPRDQADARVIGVGVEAEPPDGRRVGEHRLPHHADHDLRRGVERLRDHLGLAGHLAQGLLAIKALAARDEPDLSGGGGAHDAGDSIRGQCELVLFRAVCS